MGLRKARHKKADIQFKAKQNLHYDKWYGVKKRPLQNGKPVWIKALKTSPAKLKKIDSQVSSSYDQFSPTTA